MLVVLNPWTDYTMFTGLASVIPGSGTWDTPVLTGAISIVVLFAAAAAIAFVRPAERTRAPVAA